MLHLSDYQAVERIYESEHSVVYQGRRISDGLPVVIKLMRPEYPSPEELARYSHEFKILGALHAQGVIAALGLEVHERRRAIILEDIGGKSLNRILANRALGIGAALDLAVRIVLALGDVHAAGIIHKDINPANIVWNPDSGQLKIIDFGIASEFSHEAATPADLRAMEGTLAYISPEQTGRMNRAIDYRTDFYSLGVTLYELFCQRLPFAAHDPLELVHAHLARRPIPPCQARADVPHQLSEIIMKLLEKNADQRYQGIDGLLHDLRDCQRQWQAFGRISPFPLGRRDLSERLHVGQRLYGRAEKIALLLEAYDRAAQGGRELVLVSGAAGLGKTSLVREAAKNLLLGGARVVSGKFEQLRAGVPYQALIDAFQEQIRLILAEDEDKLAWWREHLRLALGTQGAVLAAVIPDLLLVIGPQAEVVKLPAQEANNRFRLVFQDFIRAFCLAGRPLVLFLDDLQWACLASLELLRHIASDPSLGHLLLIGTFRPPEDDPTHALHLCLADLERDGVRGVRLNLEPLAVQEVGHLLGDALAVRARETAELAELLCRKTGGNPFFIGMFLHSLHQDGLLWLDSTACRWQWDLAGIARLASTENVAALLATKIGRLRPECQHLVQLAAVMGGKFELAPLAMLAGTSPTFVLAVLQEAVDVGLIVPCGDTYTLLGLPAEEGRSLGKGAYFRFLHDRIQHVAYSLLAPASLRIAHYQLGHYLQGRGRSDQEGGGLFEIVNHLNLAGAMVSRVEEKTALARLNLRAGLKAKGSAAWQIAWRYLGQAMELMGEEGWTRDYRLTLEAHVEGAEAAYLCGKFADMEAVARTALAHGRDLLDTVRVHEVMIQAHKAQYQIQAAIDTALPVLALLGFPFPARPSRLGIALALQRTKLALLGKGMEDLALLPPMADPKAAAAIRIMNSVGSAAYFVAPELTPVLVFAAVRLIARQGRVPESPFLFAVYGMISCGVLDEIEEGCRFGQLALDLLEGAEDSCLTAKTIHMVHGFVRHWRHPLAESLAPLRQGYQAGLESGDHEYAAYSAFFYCLHSFLHGRPLAELEAEMVAYDQAIQRLGHRPSLYMQKIFHQTVAALRAASHTPGTLVGEIYDERRQARLHIEATDRPTLFYLHFAKLFLAYLFSAPALAVRCADQAAAYLDGVVGQAVVPLFHYYDSLARLASLAEVEVQGRQEALHRVGVNQKKLRHWARLGTENHEHRYQLVEAERLRALGEYSLAGDRFDAAIALARANGFLVDEALANELAALCYQARGKSKVAQAYMQEARYCYLQWGATAKVAAMDSAYRRLLPAGAVSQQGVLPGAGLASITTMSSGAEFDLASIVKASQAISGEIVLGSLLRKLMQIILENAGAERGFLLMRHGGELRIEAEGAAEAGEIEVLTSLSLAQCPRLSAAVARYVDRTQEPLVLDNAGLDPHFQHDPYVRDQAPKSVLCLPLVHAGTCLGVLYLENNAVEGAFTPQRLRMLHLLCSQVAISLENARLFSDLEQSEGRYRELYDNLVDIVLLVNAQGAIRMANPLFFSMLGLSRDEARDLDFRRMVHPDDLAMVEEKLLAPEEGAGVVRDLQFRLVGANHMTFDVECNAKGGSHAGGSGATHMVIRDVTDRKRLEKDLFDSLRDAQNAKKGTILGLAKLAEYRDKDTGSHLERIREYSRVIAEDLSGRPDYQNYIGQRYIDDIYLSSILHDIGKVGIPDGILLKPGSLTAEEFEIMKRHPTYGGDALAAVESQIAGQSFIALGKAIAYYHHEKWDGSGYPYGLKGEDIPLSTRIVALVDVYDALTSKRSYKEAFSHAQATAIIVDGKGSHFAPDVVDAFLANENKFVAIRTTLMQ